VVTLKIFSRNFHGGGKFCLLTDELDAQ
jgi:hypothetical protein